VANQNKSSAFASDIANYIQEKTLPLTQRFLVAFQFGDPLTLPKNMGTTYTATRYQRLPLPIAPLQEGVPSVGESMTLSQVTATAQQWGDSVYITDVAELTISHPLFKKAIQLCGLQIAETFERNTFNALLAGSNVFYANSKSSRANLVATDVLSVLEINKAVGSLVTTGAPMFMGPEDEDVKIDVAPLKGGKSPLVEPHYIAMLHTLVVQDLRQNQTITNAWSYSDVNRLYNWELGSFGGSRYTASNMVPFWTGAAAIATPTAVSGGTFAAGNYVVAVTASVAQTGVEQIIYQYEPAVTLTLNQALQVVLPTLPGFTFNVYVSLAGGSTPNNIGLSASGPTSGAYAGYATQLASGSTVVITGAGPTITSLASSATPTLIAPSPPATGVTVFPTFFVAKGAYGQVTLDNVRFEYLNTADKSDPHNQLRLVSWKAYYGSIILNQSFFIRCESASAFTNLIANNGS
jgi:N4-gp56 family major capsid protein